MRSRLAVAALALAACSPPPAANPPQAGASDSRDRTPPVAGAPEAPSEKPAATPGGDPAVALFERRVAEDPRDAPSRAILAHLYLRRWELRGDAADLDRAEGAARDALHLDPSHGQAVSHLARALTGLHRYDEALRACADFLDERGAHVFVLEARCDAALESARWTEAEAYADVLLSRSTDAPAILAQARLAEVRGDPVRGASLARDAAAAAERQGMLPHEIARCHVAAGGMATRAGRFDEARADFERALVRSAGHAGALDGLATLARLERRPSDAVRLAREAAGARPGPRELFRAGDDSRAVALCEARPEVFGRELAEHLLHRGRDLERALRLADADVAVRPDPDGLVLRARILLALGRADHAAEALDAAAAPGSRSPAYLEARARVESARGDAAAAKAALDELSALSPAFVPDDLRPHPEAPR